MNHCKYTDPVTGSTVTFQYVTASVLRVKDSRKFSGDIMSETEAQAVKARLEFHGYKKEE